MIFKTSAAIILLAIGLVTNNTILVVAARREQRIKYKKGFLRRQLQTSYCDDTKMPQFAAKGSPTKGSCMKTTKGATYEYPNDFVQTDGVTPLRNAVTHYECQAEGKRIIVSNGIPDHKHVQSNPNAPCEMDWYVELPLNPTKQTSITELEHKGIIAMAINGVPAYGAMEGSDGNAMAIDGQFDDAAFWYGHATMANVDHYHNSQMGKETVSDEVLLGYALDGFKIYGYTNKPEKLDECNGRKVKGEYRYYVRKVDDDVGLPDEYCDDTNLGSTNWRYILGCYHGDVTKTKYGSAQQYTIPSGCVEVNPTCVDSMAKYTLKGKIDGETFKKKKAKCSWVAENVEDRCNLKIKNKNSVFKGQKAKDVCPETCNTCQYVVTTN